MVAVSARVLQVYDAHTLKPLGSIPAGVGPSHIVARGATAYVADTQGEEILVYAIGPHPRLLGKVAAPGTPYGLAIDPGRERLWVTETATDRLAEYSLGGRLPRRVATYPVLRQPNSVAVDPRTGQVFVAGRDAGRVERITPAEGQRMKLPRPPKPHLPKLPKPRSRSSPRSRRPGRPAPPSGRAPCAGPG